MERREKKRRDEGETERRGEERRGGGDWRRGGEGEINRN